MRLHIGTIERKLLRKWPRSSDLGEDSLPDSSSGPARIPIVDGLRRSILGRHVAPASTRLQDVKDAADHPPIINAGLARLVVRETRIHDPFAGCLSEDP